MRNGRVRNEAPVLMLMVMVMVMVMVYAIVCIPIGWMWFQEKRTIAALPVVTVDDTDYAGECRRVEGAIASDAVY